MTLPRGRRSLIRAAVSSAVSVAGVWLLWRQLHGVELPQIHVQAVWIVLGVLGTALFLGGRSERFRVLLPRHRPPRRGLLGVTGVSWGVGLLLPGPSADASFIAMAWRLRIGMVRATGVNLIGRAFDLISLGVVVLVACNLSSFTERPAPIVVSVLIAAAALGACVLLASRRTRGPLLALAGRSRRFGPLALRAEEAIVELSSTSRIARLVMTTVVCRVGTGIAYFAYAQMAGLTLDFWQVWFALAIRTLLSTIPVQGLAGAGTAQVWWTTALALEGVPLSVALPASIAIHLLDMAVSLPMSLVTSLFLPGAPAGEEEATETDGAGGQLTGIGARSVAGRDGATAPV